ncbi:unnamed protein product [Knipowitschia caucasica]
MDPPGPPATARFRNVGRFYFPQIRVECHVSLGPEPRWSNRDWIGIFKVGWTSLKEYYTYTWVNVPDSFSEGAAVDCCALFHAFYLPRPGPAEYQFVYVDQSGLERGRSGAFTFCSPKPLEELETVREEPGEEAGTEGEPKGKEEEELMLVVPRATLLQRRLEDSVKRVLSLQAELDQTRSELREERERRERGEREWGREREALTKEMSEMKMTIAQYTDTLQRMEGTHQNVKYNQENLSTELSKLLREKEESVRRIQELQEDLRTLTEREREDQAEADRLRERVKKYSSQMKHEEEKRKALQSQCESLSSELRGLQERLDSSELQSPSLRRDLREITSRHSQLHTELQQSRLQGAQLSLQLSQDQLQLREERATWTLEREESRVAAETEQKRLEELNAELRRTEVWLQDERAERERLERELHQLRAQQRELQELKSVRRKTETEEQQSSTDDTEEDPCPKEDGETACDEDTSSSSSPQLCSQSSVEEEEELYESAKDDLSVHRPAICSDLCDPYMW